MVSITFRVTLALASLHCGDAAFFSTLHSINVEEQHQSVWLSAPYSRIDRGICSAVCQSVAVVQLVLCRHAEKVDWALQLRTLPGAELVIYNNGRQLGWKEEVATRSVCKYDVVAVGPNLTN